MKVQRYPFGYDGVLWGQDQCKITLYRFNPIPGSLKCFERGLPLELLRFFVAHAKCAHCGAMVSGTLARCKCGRPDIQEAHLEICYPTNLGSAYQKAYNCEIFRLRSEIRSARIKDNGGTFDRRHIEGMHKAQQGLCYYCASPIELGSKALHADHYDPIAIGGRNDLANMVLTCAACNHAKGPSSGKSFDGRSRKNRTPELAQLLRLIRADLREYKRAALKIQRAGGKVIGHKSA